MKIALVIPAYNEEEFLPVTLKSLLAQKHRPDMIMLVDDGSVDGTPQICKSYAESYDNISYVTNLKKEKRASGSKVVRAFNLGYKQLHIGDYDIVAKIDSDMGFPEDYFERVVKAFESDDTLGLYGGVCLIEKDGKWVDEKVAKLDHVRGGLKAYRVSAFRQMEGLRTIMGWDSIDEFLLRFNGWKVLCDPSLKVKHYRVTHSINGWLKECQLTGEVYNNLGYNLLIAMTSSVKVALTKSPFIITGIIAFWHYIKQRFINPNTILSKDQKKYINSYRLKNIFKKK